MGFSRVLALYKIPGAFKVERIILAARSTEAPTEEFEREEAQLASTSEGESILESEGLSYSYSREYRLPGVYLYELRKVFDVLYSANTDKDDTFPYLDTFGELRLPPPLRGEVEYYLRFYCDYFLPRCYELKLPIRLSSDTPDNGTGLPLDNDTDFFKPVLALMGTQGGFRRLVLWERFQAGLLRATQVRLLAVLLVNTIHEMQMLLRNDNPGSDVIEHIFEVLEESWRFAAALSGERFRSERLELLLLKHLDDKEAINGELVETLRWINWPGYPAMREM